LTVNKRESDLSISSKREERKSKKELIESIDSSLGFLKPKSLNSAHSKLLYILFVIYKITGMYFSEFEM
jgi:hypothetical protein